MPTLTALAEEILQRLAWSSLQACVLIAAVALLLRLAPRLPAATRSALWWLVGAQLLLGLAWSHPVALPLLAPPAVPVAAPLSPPAVAIAQQVDAPMPALGPAVTTADQPVRGNRLAAFWPGLVLLGWLVGLVWQLPRLWRQWRQACAVRATAEPLRDAVLHARCQRQACALGLRRCPELRQCAQIASPQVAGWLRPVVLLPARQALDATEWDMAVAHELAHLARRDLWLGLVPALAQRLFFFHPAVRWAMREYALHREAACDARVMRDHHVAVQTYGRLLLRLGVSHPLHAGLAGASPTFDNLKRRLLMLQQSVNDSAPRSRGWLLVALVALAGVLPYRVTAGDASAKAPAAPAAQAAPAASAAPSPLPTPRPMTAGHVPPPPPPPAPPAPAAPLPPPPPPPPPELMQGLQGEVTINRSAQSGLALFDGKSTYFNGSDRDFAQAQKLLRQGEPLLWFRRADQAYLVRDPATIARAKAVYRPLTELAREQGKLAGQQGRLAGKQAGLAARGAGLAQAQAQIAAQQAELAAQAAAGEAGRETDAARTAREARQRDLDAQHARLQQKQAQIEQELAAQQHELEGQQTAFARQQQALGQHQQQVSRDAERQMQQLLDEAVRNGTARPVDAG